MKKRIEEKHGFNHETFKLVFNQHILDNVKQLKEYSLQDGNVIIMMNSTVKPKPKEPEPEKKKEEDNKPVTTTTNTNTTNTTTTTTTVKKEEPKPQPQRVEKNYDNEVNELVDMGFSKEESKACIKAARGNLSLAVEFLGSGIPDNLPPEDMDLGSGSGGLGQGQEQGGDRQSQTTALLKNIASIVKVISQNDETQLANMLQAVEQSDPALFNLISENQDQFKKLITEPVTEEDLRAFTEFTQRGQMGRQGGSGGQGQRQRQDGKIPVTKDEMDAINRLKAFGFTEMDVVQAYFACDKNEELAINFLFDNKAKEAGDDYDYSETMLLPNQQTGVNVDVKDKPKDTTEKPKETTEKPKESTETQQKKEEDKPKEEEDKPKEESEKKDDESK